MVTLVKKLSGTVSSGDAGAKLSHFQQSGDAGAKLSRIVSGGDPGDKLPLNCLSLQH